MPGSAHVLAAVMTESGPSAMPERRKCASDSFQLASLHRPSRGRGLRHAKQGTVVGKTHQTSGCDDRVHAQRCCGCVCYCTTDMEYTA